MKKTSRGYEWQYRNISFTLTSHNTLISNYKGRLSSIPVNPVYYQSMQQKLNATEQTQIFRDLYIKIKAAYAKHRLY